MNIYVVGTRTERRRSDRDHPIEGGLTMGKNYDDPGFNYLPEIEEIRRDLEDADPGWTGDDEQARATWCDLFKVPESAPAFVPYPERSAPRSEMPRPITVTIHARVRGDDAASDYAASSFIDSFNEWAHHPEVEKLMLRVPHPLAGQDGIPADATEPDYGIKAGD